MTFLDEYNEINMNRGGWNYRNAIIASSTDPLNQDECAAYCEIVSNNCDFYHYDTTDSVCYAGLLSHTSGNWKFDGETVSVMLHKGIMIGFVNTNPRLRAKVQEVFADGAEL